jgi:hypothetical protein
MSGSDNVPLPASGVKAAARIVDYSGEAAQVQAVALVTVAGADDAKAVADVSPNSPLPVAAYGELVEALQAIYLAVDSLCRSIGYALPNALGQPIFEARQATPGNLQVTASLASSQTLTTLTNQTQIGGFAANDQVFALMRMAEDALISNTSRVT